MIVTLFDTETTGLIANRTLRIVEQPSVIEFYSVSVNLKTGKFGKEFETLIKPPMTKQVIDAFDPEKAKMKKGKLMTIDNITGITLDMLEDAPTMEEVFPKIKKIMEASEACAAHNLHFDKEMLDIEGERIGNKISWPKKLICTIEQTMHIKGYRLNLTALYEYLFNETFPGAHRAKADTHAQARVAIELFKRGML